MLLSLLVAVYTMGIARKIPIKTVMDSCTTAITHIGMMLLIIGGGGAFKQGRSCHWAGSLVASHVNDAGFWMFKEYFGLCMKETFATWTLLETIISIAGLAFVLLLSLFV